MKFKIYKPTIGYKFSLGTELIFDENEKCIIVGVIKHHENNLEVVEGNLLLKKNLGGWEILVDNDKKTKHLFSDDPYSIDYFYILKCYVNGSSSYQYEYDYCETVETDPIYQLL